MLFLKSIKSKLKENTIATHENLSFGENLIENGNFVDGSWSNFESPLAYAYFKKEPEVINYIKDLEKDLGYSLLSIVL